VLTAIPTEYHGVTFRSKLESRWAEFFDLLEMPWKYEPFSLTTPIGRYTPDFFAAMTPGPAWDWVLEIKPDGYQPTTHDRFKWAAAEDAHPDLARVTLYGSPDSSQLQRLIDAVYRRTIPASTSEGFLKAYEDALRAAPYPRDPYPRDLDNLPELTVWDPFDNTPPERRHP